VFFVLPWLIPPNSLTAGSSPVEGLVVNVSKVRVERGRAFGDVGRRLIRRSNWTTTEGDVERSGAAIRDACAGA
jgi:hypothetical protein